ncbi:MAG: zinc-binding metallopeptidase family protein [Oceanobacter sp.]
MKLFQCPCCSQTIYFENEFCGACGAAVGYECESQQFFEIPAEPANASGWKPCANRVEEVCNWLLPADDPESLCQACRLNRYIPEISDTSDQENWSELESAKHRLIFSLKRLGLPIMNKLDDPQDGLAFDFIDQQQTVPEDASVMTGHADGLVTINTDEADSVEREQARQSMEEPYRTLIGHFRHEVGHYYWQLLVQPNSQLLADYRQTFGDETLNYQDALARHYEQGAPADWQQSFVSAYASSHPWEDWAETWAHYLHLMDTLETAHAFNLALTVPAQPQGMTSIASFDPYEEASFDKILDNVVPLMLALNGLNRSMGQPDSYPFVLSPVVAGKLAFIHNMLRGAV